MKGFRYKHGDRPLEGYTIQRAAGKGGFGEVYYAVSDSGREVALKVIYGYEQIELRGVSQCMNLKSPHLVTIFDVRHNDEGLPFVIMEYVGGPSLRGLLDESPGGLGTQKSAFFLREIGKGLSYLHECGVVHRDLKPGNIFYENGYAKIGDYGLSKAMSASQHSGQTITVGTVHYMAPEIGAGKYDKSIDIYAMGAVLYEMLTGTVPYLGGSPGEILMKHLSAEPDVSRIEEPFATVIKKAMAKNPAERYQSIQEMVEAVFGADHVRESVSCFAPESLSMIAQRVADRVAVGAGAGSKTPPPIPTGPRRDRGGDVWEQMGRLVDRAGDRVAQMGDRVANNQWWPASERRNDGRGAPGASQAADAADPLTARQRRVLAMIVLGVLTVAVSILIFGNGAESAWFSVLVTTAAIAGGVLLAGRKLLPQLTREGTFVQRLAVGGMAAVFTLVLGGMTLVFAESEREAERLMFSGFAALLPLFLLDWVKVMSPARPQRVMLGHAFAVGAVALAAAVILPAYAVVAIGLAAGASLLVQVLSPWHNPQAARATAATPQGRKFEPVIMEVPQQAAAALETPTTAPTRPWWQAKTWGEVGRGAEAAAPAGSADQSSTPANPASGDMRVPRFARYLWLALTTISLPLGIMLCVYPNYENNIRDEEFAMFIGFGVGQMAFAVVCFLKSFQTSFTGWWRYLIKPLFLWACVQSVLLSAIMLGSSNLRGDEAMVATFFIVFPIVVALALTFAGFFRSDEDRMVVGATSGAAAGADGSGAARVMSGEGMNASAEAVTTAMPTTRPDAPAAWSPTLVAQYMPSPSTIVHNVVAFVGWMLLLAGTVLGLCTAADVPGMVMLDARMTGGPTPGMVRLFMGVGTFVVMLIACGLLMGSRRPHGVAHMLRGLFAVVAAGACIGFVNLAFTTGGGLRASVHRATGYSSSTLPLQRTGEPRVNSAAVIEQYIDDMRVPFLIPAGLAAVVSATLLTWPAKRQQAAVVNS